MQVVRIEGLPPASLDAAAEFHAVWLPRLLNPPPLGEVARRRRVGEGLPGAAHAPSVSPDGLPPPPRGEDLLLVFPPADHTHRLWRLAAVQELARVAAPRRVNGVAAMTETGLGAAHALIDSGQGITGQYLVLDEASVVLGTQ